MTQDLYSQLATAAEYGQPLNPQDLSDGLASRDPHVVWMAVKAAGVHNIPSARTQLFQLGRRSDWPEEVDVASIAAWSLARIGGDETLRMAYDLAFSDEDSDRRFAADVLGGLRDPRNLEPLERLAADSSKQVALWAALSLSKFGSDGIAPLERAASHVTSAERTIIIADALCKIGTPPATELARRLLAENEEIPDERAATLIEVLRTRAAG